MDPSEAPPAESWKPPAVHARDIVRIFQCRLCSVPYRDAVTLPCGRSICKSCLPESHARTSITYPALPNRIQAFQCPLPDCTKEHVLDDCGVDVILNKVASIVGGAMGHYQAEAVELRQSTSIAVEGSWDKAGIGPSESGEHRPRTISGTRLVATWTLAADGALKFDAGVVYLGSPSPPAGETFAEYDAKALSKVQEVMRTEMDCQICYALFHDPLTTGCGHTFCRPCLHRILDHSRYCPICRRKLAINSLLKPSSCPSNERITNIIQTFWKDEMMARQEAVAAERAARHQDLDVPLFVCTLSFPMMPTFLHIFEPRYRLMIRRAGDAHFHELGTLLRIVNAQFYPDGRSLIETVGLSRFRVGHYGQLDGYIVGRTERIDDVSLEEEEAIEAAEVGYDSGVGAEEGHDGRYYADGGDSREDAQTEGDLDTMTTQSLMQFAVGFVTRMRDQSVPWLTERMLAIYGNCPDDPAIFPWWFASMLPVKDHEKYRLLETSSVRDRLKICGSWIIEMETVRWSLNGCTIL
ncbi:ATP-dependent protease la (LON) substrate-binding domain-containing protein [Hirsutella rhossiliensis]|uniref:ATP-dependent protease la (LON) substrate-binding domain-containing protein n=1 Tax=Hirsutella rhossiliensis TaxID=111463 RepID=A0A9P8SIT6_9HYPO|nr:ATP-dependent protease la (LON) substrate-binding domain-containing protein [Hirsutella rhossiliensis]KAH0963529.1 ATP-dependent protease la (LON) substrate-binding domain-containing protein [Hirsutella rhossiliensis]